MKNQKRLYRIGTTSYIFPEEMLPNVRKLRDKVEDIELLFFESQNFPENGILNELKKMSGNAGITYTIHLPLDTELAGADRNTREKSLAKTVAIIKKTARLNPQGYILHIGKRNADLSSLSEWQNRARNSIKTILEGTLVEPSKICPENLNYPMEFLDEIITEFKLSVCLDVGHLMLHRFDIRKYFRKYISVAKIIHLCGIDSSGKHKSLKKVDPGIVEWLKNYLLSARWKGILTLEVFSEDDLKESMEVMKFSKEKKENL